MSQVTVQTDASVVSRIKAGDFALLEGRVIVDGGVMKYSDGSAFRVAAKFESHTNAEIVTLASSAENVGRAFIDTDDIETPKLIVDIDEIRPVNVTTISTNILVAIPGQEVTLVDIGATETSRRDAFATAIALLVGTSGARVQMPALQHFVIPGDDIEGDQLTFDGNWAYFSPQNASQNQVLRFTGNGCRIENVAGDSLFATGAGNFGKFLVAIGDHVHIDNIAVLGTSPTGSARNPIHTTGDNIAITNIYTYQQNGGILHDGGTYSLRNVICEDYGGTGSQHCITSNTTVADASFSYINIKATNLGRANNSGFMNVNSNIATDARLGNILYESCDVERTVMNNTATVPTFKVSPARSFTIKNCTMKFADFSGVATANASETTDGFTQLTGTVFLDGDRVRVTGTLPAPMAIDTDYWIINPVPASSTFQVSESLGGPILDLTTNGGTITFTRQVNPGGINCVTLSDGVGGAYTGVHEFDQIRIVDSDLTGTLGGGGLRAKQLEMTGTSVDLTEGLTGTWAQTFTADTTTINNCTFNGCTAHWFNYASPYQSDFQITESEFIGVSTAGVFAVGTVGDMANYKFNGVTLTGGIIWITGSPLNSGIMAAKKRDTYDLWETNGGNTVGVPSSPTIRAGSRIINQDTEEPDYGWSGSAWVPINTGGSGLTDPYVTVKGNNVAASANTINSYTSAGNFGTAPALEVNSFYAMFARDTGILTEYIINSTVTAWIEVATPSGSGVLEDVTVFASSDVLDDTHRTCLIDASAGAVTLTLPLAASYAEKRYNIKCIDLTNAATVDGNGAETIEGSVNYGFANVGDSIEIQTDGTEWKILATSITAAPSDDVVTKASVEQSEVSKINVYATQADIGAPPTYVANTTYSTLFSKGSPVLGTELASYIAVGGSYVAIGSANKQTTEALALAQTTIDVENHADSIIVTSATAETITGLDGGTDGRQVTLHLTDSNVGISQASGFDLDGGAGGNYAGQAGGASFVFEYVSGTWKELTRSIF